MNREQRQALLRSARMVKMEDLTEGQLYRIQHLSPSYVDDDYTTVIVQLETSEGAYAYTSWPPCPFDLDDVSRIKIGVSKCMMMNRMFNESRIIYISIYL